MSVKNRAGGISLSHTVFLVIVIATSSFLFWDSWRSSAKFQNLILIAPMATTSILMALAILASHLLQKPVQKEKTKKQQSPQDLKKILLIIASFGFYTGFLTVIGFDIATFLFISATLWIQGKQKVIPLILYAFLFTLIVVLVFKFLLPYPMKTVVF